MVKYENSPYILSGITKYGTGCKSRQSEKLKLIRSTTPYKRYHRKTPILSEGGSVTTRGQEDVLPINVTLQPSSKQVKTYPTEKQ